MEVQFGKTLGNSDVIFLFKKIEQKQNTIFIPYSDKKGLEK